MQHVILGSFFGAGIPCDRHGEYLPPNSVPSPNNHRRTVPVNGDAEETLETLPLGQEWAPYENRVEFELAEFLFKKSQMPHAQINTLMHLWAASLAPHDAEPPFANHADLHSTIDATTVGDAPWESFSTRYTGDVPEGDTPSWMLKDYEVWYRDPRKVIQNMLSNPELDGEVDYTPFQEFGENGERRWKDFMSGNWAWTQAVSFPMKSAQKFGAADVECPRT